MEGLNLLKIGEAIKIRRIKQRIHQTKLAEQRKPIYFFLSSEKMADQRRRKI